MIQNIDNVWVVEAEQDPKLLPDIVRFLGKFCDNGGRFDSNILGFGVA